jgi:phage terminase large subunit
MTPTVTNVLRRNLQAFRSGSKLIVNSGGQGSSKTISILQLLYLIAKWQGNKRITIASYALPHLKQGAMMDFDKILESFGENPGAVKNKSESIYYIDNSTIEFFGIEGNIAKAHGPRRDILYINECNRKITYDVFDQLNTRTQECTFVDFNPDQEFWLHEKVLPNFPHAFIKSNYLDNPYLPDNERRNIEMKRDKPGFENWWRVYGLGELGKLEGAIFPNWSYGEFDEDVPMAYGLDFGFNDPDAMTRVGMDFKRKIIYCEELIYKSGNSYEQLIELMRPRVHHNGLVIGDCADKRMIYELQNHFNIKPANKGKWTVADGLKMMQSYEFVITENSSNLAKEMNNYIWNDEKSGVPIGDFNHLIDGIRYVFVEFIDKLRGGAEREN